MIDKLNEVTKPFQALFINITERFSNPLGGAFLFSWIVVNWQAVYYFFFSDQKTIDKIEYLKALYMKTETINEQLITTPDYVTLFGFPALCAVIYLIASPIISNSATGVWSWLNTTSESLRMKWFSKTALMTKEDNRKMWEVVEKDRLAHKEELKALQDEIDGLKNIRTLGEEQEKNTTSDVFELSLGRDEQSDAIKMNLSEMRKALTKTTTLHTAKLWIAEKYELDYDNPHSKSEVEFTYTIIQTLLTNSEYIPDIIRSGSTSHNKNKVEGELYRLEQKGLVTKDKSNGTYSLSTKAIEVLQDIINGKKV